MGELRLSDFSPADLFRMMQKDHTTIISAEGNEKIPGILVADGWMKVTTQFVVDRAENGEFVPKEEMQGWIDYARQRLDHGPSITPLHCYDETCDKLRPYFDRAPQEQTMDYVRIGWPDPMAPPRTASAPAQLFYGHNLDRVSRRMHDNFFLIPVSSCFFVAVAERRRPFLNKAAESMKELIRNEFPDALTPGGFYYNCRTRTLTPLFGKTRIRSIPHIRYDSTLPFEEQFDGAPEEQKDNDYDLER